MPPQRFLYVLIGLMFLNKEGGALECFSCSSIITGSCGLEFDKYNANVEACTAASNACFKGLVTTPQNKTVVVRSCGTEFHCMLYDSGGCYTCGKNLCNNSLKVSSNFLITFILGLLRMFTW